MIEPAIMLRIQQSARYYAQNSTVSAVESMGNEAMSWVSDNRQLGQGQKASELRAVIKRESMHPYSIEIFKDLTPQVPTWHTQAAAMTQTIAPDRPRPTPQQQRLLRWLPSSQFSRGNCGR
jgi:hypothetical protein